MSRWLRSVLSGLLAVAGVLLAPTAHALDPTRSILQMYHRAYTQADGAPTDIKSVAQTADGYIWIGADDGLHRFDGQRFDRFPAKRLAKDSISVVRATHQGDLWVGYSWGGLSRIRGSQIVHYTSEQGGPSGEGTTNILISRDGSEAWAVVGRRLWRRTGGKWRQLLPDAQVYSAAIARDDVVWVKNFDGVFYCRPRGGSCARAAGYAGSGMGLAQDRAGRVWTADVARPGRMYRLPDIANVPDAEIPPREYGGTVSARIAGPIFIDRDGSLWCVNGTSGLLRARSALERGARVMDVDAYTAADGLTHDMAGRIFEDREGNIWVSTKAGLDMFRSANVVVERAIPVGANRFGYSAGPIGDLLYIHASTGTDNSDPFGSARGPLFRMLPDGSVERVLDDIWSVQRFARTDDGSIWMASLWGLFRLQGKGFVDVARPPGGETTTIVSVLSRPGNGLWVWQRGNGAWILNGGRWQRDATMPSAQTLGFIQKADPGRDGAIWTARADPYALVRRDPRGLKRFSEADVGIGPIRVVYPDRDVEYVGGEQGLAAFDGTRFHRLGTDRVPELARVFGVATAGPDLWVLSASGILRFNRQAVASAMRDPRAPAPTVELFDQLDGLPAAASPTQQSGSVNTVFPRPDGRIVFLTGAAVVWIDPANLFRNRVPPPVAIQALRVNGHEYDTSRDLNLPAGTNSLEIDYASLSFVEPRRVRFRYRLGGVDDGWIDPGTRRQAFYTRLGPGTYRFQVIAANDAGVWNKEGATLSFTIAPTFLQSVWFKLLLALVLALLAWGAYALRLRQETARIQGRFDARIAERERIARELHDTLLQGFQGLMLRFQSVANVLPAGGEARAKLDDALERADATLVEGRERVRELRAPMSAVDLPQAIADAAAESIPEGGPRFQVMVEGRARELRADACEEALSVATEALRNAARHSGAALVEALVGYQRSGLTVIVLDDGKGIDPALVNSGSREGHYGLVGMRERAERISGRLVVRSRDGAGVEVSLFIPAARAYADHAPRFRFWRRTGAAS
ncbi:triple tyrosine motif-containing protein [Sphingomonas kyeonggiensis]|uniref:Signal transduction histidine kinase/ligand-binding sensor domain-containing protein n=1 Tax=Sphingomonas kyeonggiensis TaxID=1268553 RepID=A0A7W6JWP0_9SPHN|nr:signal transduction histidine kinase/ligand-binding sensor domain-containing protein [Sphingomonas kyeonggiensis]